MAVLSILVGHRTEGAPEDPAEQAGALLAAGRTADAEAAARACAAPRCGLILGRALLALGRPGPAADALANSEPGLGPLQPHAQVLRGEALLLDKRPRDALLPLRASEKASG